MARASTLLPPERVDVAVAGAGVLAQALCVSFAQLLGSVFRVAILARSGVAAAELCMLAACCVRNRHCGPTFHPLVVDFESADSIGTTLRQLQPRIVISCVSYQSPWEGESSPSRWTELVQAAGFGLTLPLHWRLTARLARAVADLSPETLFINGCFPDAVNPILKAAGLPIFCGIGNVATLAAALRWTRRLQVRQTLQLLAHHRHLHAPGNVSDEAMAWIDGAQAEDLAPALSEVRSATRRKLCLIAGHEAATLVRSLLLDRALRTHVPGPSGLPGGYPVRVHRRAITLDLPADMSPHGAVAWNERVGCGDGVHVSRAGDVVFTDKAVQTLRLHARELPLGFRAAQMDVVCDHLLELRGRLRTLGR